MPPHAGEGAFRRVLVFSCGDALYAVSADQAAEVVTFGALTALPGARSHVRGVFAHRGEIIPLIDLGVLWGESPIPSSRAVLVRLPRGAFGLLTTGVKGVEELEVPDAPVGAGGLGSAVRPPVELRGQLVTVVDVEALFTLLSEGRAR